MVRYGLPTPPSTQAAKPPLGGTHLLEERRVESLCPLDGKHASILERVGAGSWSVADMGTALAAKDRAACGPVCPPQGLYLAHVSYPVDPFAKV